MEVIGVHQSSYDKMARFVERHLDKRRGIPTKIVDIGSMDVNGTYRDLFDDNKWSYTGVDLAPGNNVDVVLSDPYRWKELPSRSFDIVVSGQVFEHMEFFWLAMFEVNRIMKVGSLSCIIVPSSGPEHKYPLDCWRFFPDGLSAMARMARLHILECYHQADAQGYDDGSDEWKDAVLICEKQVTPFFDNMKRMYASRLVKKFLTSNSL